MRIASEGLSRVLASPLHRASETAEAIGRICGAPVSVSQGLNDIDCGDWEGLSDAEVKARYPDFTTVTRSQTVNRPTADGEELAQWARVLLGRTEASARGVRLLGVSVSGLEDEPEGGQLELFSG